MMSSSQLQQRRRRICLFGTSGDPPTGDGGHATIVRTLSSLTIPISDPESSLYYFDQVWVLPVFQHMYSNKRNNQTSFQHRLEMCRLAFESIPRVVVSDVEQVGYQHYLTNNTNSQQQQQQQQPRFGTVDLLEFLFQEEPETDFTLALGADTFMDLTDWKWKRAKDVIHMLQGRIIVFQRFVTTTTTTTFKREEQETATNHPPTGSGWQSEEVLYKDVDIQNRIQQVQSILQEGDTNKTVSCLDPSFPLFLHIPHLWAISSSLARSMSSVDMLSEIVSPSVLTYIQTHGLYLRQEQHL